MKEDEIKELQEELKEFQKERNAIKDIIGSIGGKTSGRNDRFLNISFITVIVILFILDVMRHILRIDIPLPALFSIEIGLLLVSIKIIWMIHKQMKVEHFQFWILNSIEYRINDISKKLTKIETGLQKDRTETSESEIEI
jgi:hypothetical protein